MIVRRQIRAAMLGVILLIQLGRVHDLRRF